jgi:hypothetical protein
MIGWTHLSGTTVSLVGGDSGVLMSHKLLAQNLYIDPKENVGLDKHCLHHPSS